MIDLNRYTSRRLNPSQARGKERIRLILTTALQLFDQKGIDRTTTNDIAQAAHIPIGSVYRYFQNKEEIILAITDLQIDDVVMLFQDIAARPGLAALSWQETMALVTDTWAKHARQNDTFAFLYFLRSSHALRAEAQTRWQRVRSMYLTVLQKHDPRVTDAETGVYIQLTWSAVELAMVDRSLASQAVTILANHLEQTYSAAPKV